jgi:hypothetical protein
MLSTLRLRLQHNGSGQRSGLEDQGRLLVDFPNVLLALHSASFLSVGCLAIPSMVIWLMPQIAAHRGLGYRARILIHASASGNGKKILCT